MKTIALSVLIASAAILSACGGSGDSKQTKAAKTIEQLLNSDGSAWSRIKDSTRVGKYSVFLSPDGSYVALDLSKYVDGMTKEQFLAAAEMHGGLAKSVDVYEKYGVIDYDSYESNHCPSDNSDNHYSCSSVYETDADGDEYLAYYDVDVTTYGWYTVRENIYTDPVTGLVFEVGDTSSKDLETVSATVAEMGANGIRDLLVANYGLSADRATEVASLAQAWNNLASRRTMTAKDLSDFQVKVFGASLDALQKAANKASQGDKKEFNSLIQEASRLNDISPEQARALANTFIN